MRSWVGVGGWGRRGGYISEETPAVGLASTLAGGWGWGAGGTSGTDRSAHSLPVSSGGEEAETTHPHKRSWRTSPSPSNYTLGVLLGHTLSPSIASSLTDLHGALPQHPGSPPPVSTAAGETTPEGTGKGQTGLD